MRRPAVVFTIALALGAISLAPRPGARADTRKEGPIEIEKCRTIDQPGAYKLVNNLTGPFDANGNCLVITTGFVTIDLAGFLISGGTTGTGILAAPSSGGQGGMAVRNGSISGFRTGVDLPDTGGSIVEGLRVFGAPAAGTFVGISAAGIVKDNFVTRIFLVGIFASGTVTGNNASLNFRDGIVADLGSTLIGNTADNNGRSGIVVTCPSNVTNNTAIGQPPGSQFPNLLLNGEGCNNTNNVAP
jgi:hypothetical protein